MQNSNDLLSNALIKAEPVSLWRRYKQSINFKSDLKSIFFRPHDRHATLDGARAITILLMVLFHVLFGIAKILGDKVEGFIQEFPWYLNWMWQAQGSDPLFVVSGLLVSYTLFRGFDKTGSINFKDFYKRRIIRIYPLFLIALIMYFPIGVRHWDYIISNLFFSSNFFADRKPIIPVAWSLEVQMQFYFLLPFLCWLVYAVRWRIALLVSLIVAAVAYRYSVVSNNPSLYQTPFYQIVFDEDFARLLSKNLYYHLDVRVGGFLMGTLVAYLHHYHGARITAYFNRHLIVNGLILLLGLYLIYWSFSFPLINKQAEFYSPFVPEANKWFLVINRYTYSFAMSILMLLALCPAGLSKTVKWFLSWPIWHPFGQLIYPIYLFHFIFIVFGAAAAYGTTDKHALNWATVSQVLLVYAWALLFTMIFASLMHIYVEKPFLKLRDKKTV